MNRDTVFIDTSFFKGLLDQYDDFHDDSISFWKTLTDVKSLVCTSNFIFDETLTLIRVRCGLGLAIKFHDLVLEDSNNITIIRVTTDDEKEAWKYFEKPWKKLSYTDCTSFALMKRMELTTVACFDDHFRKAGFKVRP